MEKTVYITEEEREKCRKVIDVFEELYEIEDEDILLVDVGRYGFVKLQCYTASHGFEELDTYTDSNSLFEGLWEEWLSLNVFLLAREMQLADVLYDDLFNNLPKEKQSELTGRKDYFAKKTVSRQISDALVTQLPSSSQGVIVSLFTFAEWQGER